MISFKDRLNAFVELGIRLKTLPDGEREQLFSQMHNYNNWFSPSNCLRAIQGLEFILEKERMEKWLAAYVIPEEQRQLNVGVLMAGNIPAVGFHDLMCVLLSGNRVSAKLSSTDSVLMRWLIDQLLAIQPEFRNSIVISEMLRQKDAYIATGSDNSARYFEYYFGKYPAVIRKNRVSVAVLSGQETHDDLISLGEDVFGYFGLGCRNVSKIFIPDESWLKRILDAWEVFSPVGDHHKYRNNYEYNKSIYLINRVSHLDNGFLLLKEDEGLVSPISVVFYEVFESKSALNKKIASQAEKIQCIVSQSDWFTDAVPFGTAQQPGPDDYADGVDTMEFLLSLGASA